MKRFHIMIWMLAALGLGVAGFTASTANGDIYSWTDENGVRYFTNYAPPKQARLLIKTPEIAYDEAEDEQRREADRLAVARQELAEREAFLLQQQQEAERRIAEANARADAALQQADQVLQDAEAATRDADYDRSSRYGYRYYYPYYGYRYSAGHHYKNHHRYYGGRYTPGHHSKYGHGRKHPYKYKGFVYKRGLGQYPSKKHYSGHHRKNSVRRHPPSLRSRSHFHRSRVATFRGRHGRY